MMKKERQIWSFILATAVLAFLVALLSGSLQCRRAIKPGASLDDFKTHLLQTIPDLMEAYSIPGCSISLVLNGEVAYSEAFGYADRERGRLLGPDTPMSVQSITKSVTAWGVLALSEDGLLDLDEPVVEHLKTWDFPDTPYSEGKVTARTLLSH